MGKYNKYTKKEIVWISIAMFLRRFECFGVFKIFKSSIIHSLARSLTHPPYLFLTLGRTTYEKLVSFLSVNNSFLKSLYILVGFYTD